jgi:hypothetical protein
MDVVVPVPVHMSVVTMVEFCLRFIKLHYSPPDFQSQEKTGYLHSTIGNRPDRCVSNRIFWHVAFSPCRYQGMALAVPKETEKNFGLQPLLIKRPFFNFGAQLSHFGHSAYSLFT